MGIGWYQSGTGWYQTTPLGLRGVDVFGSLMTGGGESNPLRPSVSSALNAVYLR